MFKKKKIKKNEVKQNKILVIALIILLFDFIFFSIPVLAKQKVEVKNWENKDSCRSEINYQLSTLKMAEKDYKLDMDLMQLHTKNIFCKDVKSCVFVVVEQDKVMNFFSENLIYKLPISDRKNVNKIEKKDLSEMNNNEKKVKEQNNLLKTQHINEYVITAYNSEKSQCDDNPCITANGFNVCDHNKEDTIATNFLKFGTKVRIPNLFGDNIFIVRDRMHKKHFNKVDVWMIDKQDALKFGVKIAKIEILE